MGDGKIVYEICKAYGRVVRTIRVGSCYDIEHGGVCRGLIEYQELDSDSVGTIVCNLYEFGFYIAPGTTFRFPQRWTSESRIEILNGRTAGGERKDEDGYAGTYINWVDGVPHETSAKKDTR
jgi:hypothetical protein